MTASAENDRVALPRATGAILGRHIHGNALCRRVEVGDGIYKWELRESDDADNPAPETPAGLILRRGQHWRIVDSRANRRVSVTVTDWDTVTMRVQIRTRGPKKDGSKRWANLSRFHGRNGGYAYVSE